MNCPYCNELMELGSIETFDTLSWSPNGESRPRTSKWAISKNGVLIDNCGLVKKAKANSNYCKSCKIVIIKL